MIRIQSNEKMENIKLVAVDSIIKCFKSYKLNIETLFLSLNILNKVLKVFVA
jgi:hypothetical protein